MIKNLIFDWSGTISDDLLQVHKAVMKTFDALGIERISLEEFRKEFTLPYMDFYKKYKQGVDKKFVDSIYIVEIGKEKSKPFKEAKSVLKFLKEKELNLIIISSIPQSQLDGEVKSYGFGDFFKEKNGGIHDKTKAVLEIMKRNGFKPEETAFVGDMTHDIIAGKKACITTIAACYGYQTREVLLAENPDHLIDSIDQLKTILGHG